MPDAVSSPTGDACPAIAPDPAMPGLAGGAPSQTVTTCSLDDGHWLPPAEKQPAAPAVPHAVLVPAWQLEQAVPRTTLALDEAIDDLRGPIAEAELGPRRARLAAAVADEVARRSGSNVSARPSTMDAATIAREGGAIIAGHAADQAAQSLLREAVAGLLVAAAQAPTDGLASPSPMEALRALDRACVAADADVRAAILRNPDAQAIIGNAVAWANGPLHDWVNDPLRPADAPLRPADAPTKEALARLDEATRGLEPSLAGAVVDRAVPDYEALRRRSTGGLWAHGALSSLCRRIAGTPQGDDAIARLAGVEDWGEGAIRDALGAGAALSAYDIAFARRAGPKFIARIVDNTRDDLMQQAGVSVQALGKHNAQLRMLLTNNAGPDGELLPPGGLEKGVAGYAAYKGEAWKAENARLHDRLAEDGAAILHYLSATAELPPDLAGTLRDRTVQSIAEDPKAQLAMQEALRRNPSPITDRQIESIVKLLDLPVRAGDLGRRLAIPLALSLVRGWVLDELAGIDLRDPAGLAQAKEVVGRLVDQYRAKLVGFGPNEAEKVVSALQRTADALARSAAAGIEDMPAAASKALTALDRDLNQIAQVRDNLPPAMAFGPSTVAGRTIRLVGVALVAVALVNDTAKLRDHAGVRDALWVTLETVWLGQRACDTARALGLVTESSAASRFALWKVGGASALRNVGTGELILGGAAVINLADAMRFGFGIGVEQDTGNAAFSLVAGVGHGMAAAPAFGAAAWAGPVGIGVTAAALIGKTIYTSHKDAKEYQAASTAFLTAAGYSATAAGLLSQRTGDGGGLMPFLARYAKLRGLDAAQIERWVNRLGDKAWYLSNGLLRAARDCGSNPDRFTADPAQETVLEVPGEGLTISTTLLNTVSGFEQYLRSEDIPLP